MKWPCDANSYPRTFHSKPFYLTNLSHREKAIANQYSDPPHPFASYSVTRVNPLYIDDANGFTATDDDAKSLYHVIDDCTAKPCKTELLYSSPLRDDSIDILKRDPNFIRSILVSVRLGRCHQRSNGLTPIPEGKVDSIPRPIWPNDDTPAERPDNEDDMAAMLQQQLLQQRHHRHYAPRSFNRAGKYRISRGEDDVVLGDSLHSESLPQILRELSRSINAAMENAERAEIPPDALLRSLRAKINNCLETICDKNDAASPTALANVYERGSCSGGDSGVTSGEQTVATLSRAFSFVNAFNDGSHRDDIEKGRLTLLKRLGRFPPPATDPYYAHVQRSSSGSGSGASSSTSSDASTSGFSDLTHTPASSNSSASDSPPACRSADCATDVATTVAAVTNPKHGEHRLQKYAVAGVDNVGSAAAAVSSALKIGCTTAHVSSAVSFAAFSCRTLQNSATSCSGTMKKGSTTFDIVAKGVGCLASQASAHLKTETLLSSYPGHRCPDFTLDVQQAEKVMKKIQERKKERCWCRVITSFVGFAFLLFSVMFFSMMFTRGDKMFGPL